MRLGGTVFYQGTDPEEYALAHVKKGFGAALCPEWVSLDNPDMVTQFKKVMKRYDIKIAEVGHGAIRCIRIKWKQKKAFNI